MLKKVPRDLALGMTYLLFTILYRLSFIPSFVLDFSWVMVKPLRLLLHHSQVVSRSLWKTIPEDYRWWSYLKPQDQSHLISRRQHSSLRRHWRQEIYRPCCLSYPVLPPLKISKGFQGRHVDSSIQVQARDSVMGFFNEPVGRIWSPR